MESKFEEINQVIKFIIEIEKLKAIHRKTRPIGLNRYENSAEHSWHVCLSALMLKEYANENINIDHTIKMLLIHDLGEIDAEDTIIYESETKEIKDKEEQGIRRMLSILPKKQRKEYLNLWFEFESGKTAESKFARAVDRIPPLLHNLYGDGHSWKKHNISSKQILSLNSKISEGSEAVWGVIRKKLDKAFTNGILNK